MGEKNVVLPETNDNSKPVFWFTEKQESEDNLFILQIHPASCYCQYLFRTAEICL